jgi:hypothetical protein
MSAGVDSQSSRMTLPFASIPLGGATTVAVALGASIG